MRAARQARGGSVRRRANAFKHRVSAAGRSINRGQIGDCRWIASSLHGAVEGGDSARQYHAPGPLLIDVEGVEGVAERPDLPLSRRLPGQGAAEEFGGRNHPGIVEPFLVERGHEPFQNMTGRLDLAIDVILAVCRILEPLRAERAITILELGEREILELADIAVGPQVGTIKLACRLEPPLAAVGEPE